MNIERNVLALSPINAALDTCIRCTISHQWAHVYVLTIVWCTSVICFSTGMVGTVLYITAFLSSGAGMSVVYIIAVEMYPTFLRNSFCGITSCIGRLATIATPFLMRQVKYMLGYDMNHVHNTPAWNHKYDVLYRSTSVINTTCIPRTLFFHDDCGNLCTLSYYNHQIGSVTHLPLSRVKSWNTGIRCMSFYILTSVTKLRIHTVSVLSKIPSRANFNFTIDQVHWHHVLVFVWDLS